VSAVSAAEPTAVRALRFVIITGLSGAGRSYAIKCLEDLGYFCVDNLPTTLIPTLAELSLRAGGDMSKVAIVVDEQLRAGHPDVYAAGDVAAFTNAALGRRLRVEHEDNALTMGALAGAPARMSDHGGRTD